MPILASVLHNDQFTTRNNWLVGVVIEWVKFVRSGSRGV